MPRIPGKFGCAFEFLERKIGRLHGTRETHESVRMPGVRRGRGVVVGLSERESNPGDAQYTIGAVSDNAWTSIAAVHCHRGEVQDRRTARRRR